MLGMSSIQYTGPEEGTSPEVGFDCSGMMYYLLHEKVKKVIPTLIAPSHIRHANEMFDNLGVAVHAEFRRPADFIFFSKNGLRPTHVGMCITKELYIHAPGKNDTEVCIDQITDSQIPLKYEGQIYARNPIGYKRLTIAYKDKRWRQEPL